MADICRSNLASQPDRALLLLLAAGLGRGVNVALQAENLRLTEAGLEMNASRRSDAAKLSIAAIVEAFIAALDAALAEQEGRADLSR